MARLIDLTGRRYGALVVLGRAPTPPGASTEAHWLCRCDCGREVVRRSANLRDRGHRHPTCGCNTGRVADLTGRRFGRWLVLGRARRRQYWLCRCECGVEREVFGPNLLSGKSTKCVHSCRGSERAD